MHKTLRRTALCTAFTLATGLSNPVLAAQSADDRISELEQKMSSLLQALQQKQDNIDALTIQVDRLNTRIAAGNHMEPAQPGAFGEIEAAVEEALSKRQAESPLSRFSFGGYGEMHANFTEGSSGDKFDIHRLVGMLGYQFSDWIRFQSEVELEHAFVDDTQKGEESKGYLLVEQAHVDFLLADQANLRVGRFLTPVGLTNQHHEPTNFYSVERPNFDKYIIPSTWSSDGIGLFGNLASNLSYEAYLAGGLNGSAFSSDGIRNGRIKDEPSLNDLALTFRFDYYPFMSSTLSWGSDLRLGASFYHGGINNGQSGKDPGIDGDITIYSGDFSARFGDVDLKGALAFEEIDGAASLSAKNVAEEMYGYFIEAGYHLLPDAWKRGRIEKSDLVAFVRYDKYDTQYEMPGGVASASGKDRQDWTFGLAFFPVPNLVLKADYQILEADGANDPADTANLGIGWQF